MKFLEQTTAILFALIAILALILAIANFANVFASGIFGLIFGFAAFAAYIIHEEASEL